MIVTHGDEARRVFYRIMITDFTASRAAFSGTLWVVESEQRHLVPAAAIDRESRDGTVVGP